jgi:hypothetical protein
MMSGGAAPQHQPAEDQRREEAIRQMIRRAYGHLPHVADTTFSDLLKLVSSLQRKGKGKFCYATSWR